MTTTTSAADLVRAKATNGHSSNGHSVKPSVVNAAEPARAETVCLADVKPERVEWLWPARIPRGMLTLLDGDPGVGKSTITLDLAARITTGVRMPLDLGSAAPADVVLIGAEDHLAATVCPRLDAAGADRRRVHAVVAVPTRADPTAPPTLANVAAIEAVVVDRKAALVVIDPVMAFLPSDVDAYRDADVRRVLAPFTAMAARTGAAILIVRHLRKGTGSALYRGGGSIGIIGAARSGLLVARDPDDPDTCVLAHAKGNLAPPAPALRYRVVDRDGVGMIEWIGVADGMTADRLAAVPDGRPRDDDKDLVDRAVEALREILIDGPQPTADVLRDVRAMTGAKPRTIERARAVLGVVACRGRDQDGRVTGWTLGLPDGPDRHTWRSGGVEATLPANHAESGQNPPDRQTATVQTATTGGGVENPQRSMWSAKVAIGASRAAGLHDDDDEPDWGNT